VIIINKGKLVATDSVNNLQNRARGVGSVLVEVAGRNSAIEPTAAQRRFEQIPGVSRVLFKDKRDDRLVFEVEGKADRAIRGDLARCVVEAGWDLNELRTAAVSLEEIFLQLTSSDQEKTAAKPAAESELEAVAAKGKE
jgi:ABC-2 type transport system ATP-binding protein